MHEREKLAEAEHFIRGMRREHTEGNRRALGFELSAFLTAGRSVLQYALKEARQRNGHAGESWYDTHMATDPLLSYFRDKRDVNIHAATVKPLAKHTSHRMSGLSIENEDDGTTEFIPNVPHIAVSTIYEFSDKPGESVLDLATRYVGLLRSIVEDGITNGFVTG